MWIAVLGVGTTLIKIWKSGSCLSEFGGCFVNQKVQGIINFVREIKDKKTDKTNYFQSIKTQSKW